MMLFLRMHDQEVLAAGISWGLWLILVSDPRVQVASYPLPRRLADGGLLRLVGVQLYRLTAPSARGQGL